MIIKNLGFEHVDISAGRAFRHEWQDPVDMYNYDGIELILRPSERALRLRVTLFPVQNGRPEFIASTRAEVSIPPSVRAIEIPFSLFDHRDMVRAHLRFIAAIEFTLAPDERARIRVEGAGLMYTGNLQIYAERSTLSGDRGDTLKYRVHILNGAGSARHLAIHADWYGREALTWEYPDELTLAPRSETQIEISARMTSAIPPGGHEARCFTITADGREARKFTLYAAKTRNEPFLLHTDSGWEKLKRAIGGDANLQTILERDYLRVADAWDVPEPAKHGKFVYPHPSHDVFFHTAIAWKLTGNGAYLDKIMRYFAGFLDDNFGYLATRYCYFEFPKSADECAPGKFDVCHAISAGWVQEGEFMARLAYAYDLVRLEPCFTPDMHEKFAACMIKYMDFVDWRLTDGDGNNFQICESVAALYFALLLQDEARVTRFLSGYNGVYDLIGAVFSDDGSYFEGASGYMRLAAEVLGRAAVACENAGVNLKDTFAPAAYDRYVMHSPWALKGASPGEKPFLGMSFERFEPARRPVRRLKDYYDQLLRLVTPQGVLFSANDSNEHDFSAVFQLAYYLYRDPAYLSVARRATKTNLLFGLHMLPLGAAENTEGGYINYGNGFAILRETGESPVQAVLKFGQHGGYHGHYDRLSLMSLMRGGTTFHNNEYAWYGYSSFLFKMWVQVSIAHNMVVVDERMQEPTRCAIVYFRDGGDFSAVCAETACRWSDPPYGGQTPYLASFPDEKCASEGRYILPPIEKRAQGDIGEYSEPVFERRLLVLAGGCCFVWDYLEARDTHTFDCFYHPMGKITSKLPELASRAPRLNTDPFGSGQFITDCHHYKLRDSIRIRFENERRRLSRNDAVDFAPYASLFSAYPSEQTMIIGRYPETADTFEREYVSPDSSMLSSQCKKSVAFRQRGKRAMFITALEIGDQPSPIACITAESYERVRVTYENGDAFVLRVTGMATRNHADIAVRRELVEKGQV